MAVERTQILHLNSATRDVGSPTRFTCLLEDGLVKATEKQTIRVTVLDVVINRSWSNVREGNNMFTVQRGTGPVQPLYLSFGYHTVLTLRTNLQQLLAGWAVTYNKLLNGFTLQPPNDGQTYKLGFPQPSHQFLGAAAGSAPTATFAAPFVSPLPVMVSTVSVVRIHSDLPRTVNSSVDNTFAGTSDILCNVPVCCPPFDYVIYKGNREEYSYLLTVKDLTQVTLYVTDQEGRTLQVPLDWSITLKIDYLSTSTLDSIRTGVQRLADYGQYMVLGR